MGKWEMVSLNDVCSLITDGTHQTPQYAEKGYMFLSSKNVKSGKIDWKEIKYIPEELHNQLYSRIAPRLGDILLAKNGTTGVAAVVDKDVVFDIYVSLALLRPTDVILSEYLLYAINNPITKRKFNSKLKGIGVPNLHLQNIRETTIRLPPLETQKQIAKTLDTASELLGMRKQQLAELGSLIKSTFYDMFGDPVTNEKGWEAKKLAQIGQVNRGMSKHRPRNAPALLGGEHPLIQTGDVANSDFIIREYKQTYSDLGLKQSKKWPAGTLCITIAANIAKTAIMGFDACFPDSVVGFTANTQTNNIFVFSWFGFFQKILEAQAPESAQKNINLKILNDLDVILPPIEIQTQFADIVTKIEEQKNLVKKAIDETQYLFDSLMSEYFE